LSCPRLITGNPISLPDCVPAAILFLTLGLLPESVKAGAPCTLSVVPAPTDFVARLGDGTTSNGECSPTPPVEASKGSSVGFSNQTGTVTTNAGIFEFKSTGESGTSGSGTLFGYTALAAFFELSGPGANVMTALNVDYYAINELVSGTSTKGNGLIGIHYRVRNDSGGEIFTDDTLIEFGLPIGTPSQGTWTSASGNLPTGTALIIWLEVSWQVGINTVTWPNSAQFKNTGWVSFKADEVFTFGAEGFTANSTEVNIVNNLWYPPPIFFNNFE